MIKERIKSVFKLLIAFMIFFYIVYPFVFIFYWMGFPFHGIGYSFTASMFDFIVSGVLTVIITLFYGYLIRDGVKKFKSNPNGSVNSFLEFFAIIILLYGGFLFVSSFTATIADVLSSIINVEVTTGSNQATLEEMGIFMPFLLVVSAVLFAPIEEELLFRGGIGTIIKNKKVFIAISGLIFGLMHVTTAYWIFLLILIGGIILDIILEKKKINPNNLKVNVKTILEIILIFAIGFFITYLTTMDINEGLNSFSYIGAGLYLATVYAKTDNIIYPLVVHMLSNGVASILIMAL